MSNYYKITNHEPIIKVFWIKFLFQFEVNRRLWRSDYDTIIIE